MLIRVTVASPKFATQTSSSVATIAAGALPTTNRCVTVIARGSIRITVSSLWLATQTDPPPKAMAPGGVGPTAIWSTT